MALRRELNSQPAAHRAGVLTNRRYSKGQFRYAAPTR